VNASEVERGALPKGRTDWGRKLISTQQRTVAERRGEFNHEEQNNTGIKKKTLTHHLRAHKINEGFICGCREGITLTRSD